METATGMLEGALPGRRPEKTNHCCHPALCHRGLDNFSLCSWTFMCCSVLLRTPSTAVNILAAVMCSQRAFTNIYTRVHTHLEGLVWCPAPLNPWNEPRQKRNQFDLTGYLCSNHAQVWKTVPVFSKQNCINTTRSGHGLELFLSCKDTPESESTALFVAGNNITSPLPLLSVAYKLSAWNCAKVVFRVVPNRPTIVFQWYMRADSGTQSPVLYCLDDSLESKKSATCLVLTFAPQHPRILAPLCTLLSNTGLGWWMWLSRPQAHVIFQWGVRYCCSGPIRARDPNTFDDRCLFSSF